MQHIEEKNTDHYENDILAKVFRMNNIHPELQTAHISVPPGVLTPTDSHQVKECWFITSGMGQLILPKNTPLKEGDFIYFDPFEKHAIKNISENTLKILSIWWP